MFQEHPEQVDVLVKASKKQGTKRNVQCFRSR